MKVWMLVLGIGIAAMSTASFAGPCVTSIYGRSVCHNYPGSSTGYGYYYNRTVQGRGYPYSQKQVTVTNKWNGNSYTRYRGPK